MKPARLPRRGDPLVRQLFENLDRSGMQGIELTRKAGVDRGALHRWRYDLSGPTLANFKACLQVLGLELAIKPAKISGKVSREISGRRTRGLT